MCVCPLHADTYVFPSVSICVVLAVGAWALHSYKRSASLKVFTADSYFMRRVGCRKLKRSTGIRREIISIGGFCRSGCSVRL